MPFAGEPDGHDSGYVLRDARCAKGVVRPQAAALVTGQESGQPGPGEAGPRRIDACQRTGRAGRDLCLDRRL